MNRLMRRMQMFGKGRDVQQRGDGAADTSAELSRPGTPQDVSSVRAKNSGHGKKTADKWNQ